MMSCTIISYHECLTFGRIYRLVRRDLPFLYSSKIPKVLGSGHSWLPGSRANRMVIDFVHSVKSGGGSLVRSRGRILQNYEVDFNF